MVQRKMVRPVRSRREWAVRFLLIALAVFLFLKAVQLYGQIQEKQRALAFLNQQIQTQMVKNESDAALLEDPTSQVEMGAYDSGNLRPGEQVFQSEAG